MKHISLFTVPALSAFLFACGSSSDGSGGNGSSEDGDPMAGMGDPGVDDPGMTDPGNPGVDDPGVDDPGNPGVDDPPPDANPCNIHSGYPGDELCMVAPSAEEGIQLHAGPADYDDPEAMAAFVIQPGEENVKCYTAPMTESGFHYLRQVNHMRTGSHHMLIGVQKGASGCDLLGSLASIPGSQSPAREYPSDEAAPEDAGLARALPQGATTAAFQLHYVNVGDVPQLREAWVNIYRLPESDVKQHLNEIFLVGDVSVNIPAHTRQTTTLTFAPQLAESTRVFDLSAHSHAHSEDFTVWRIRGGVKELLYKSFNWAEPRELTYNTVVTNPPPDADLKTDGGISGLLYLEPGDSLQWACNVNNTSDAALHFANEAYTAEMCLLPGDYVGNTPGLMRGGCTPAGCLNRF